MARITSQHFRHVFLRRRQRITSNILGAKKNKSRMPRRWRVDIHKNTVAKVLQVSRLVGTQKNTCNSNILGQIGLNWRIWSSCRTWFMDPSKTSGWTRHLRAMNSLSRCAIFTYLGRGGGGGGAPGGKVLFKAPQHFPALTSCIFRRDVHYGTVRDHLCVEAETCVTISNRTYLCEYKHLLPCCDNRLQQLKEDADFSCELKSNKRLIYGSLY
jgi:hypothetical protein